MKAQVAGNRLELVPKNRSELATLLKDIILHIDKNQFIHLMRILLTNIINISKSESIINVDIDLQNNPASTFSFQEKYFLKINISYKVNDSVLVKKDLYIYTI